MKENPRLVDLIIAWMEKELPKAKIENITFDNETGPSPHNKRFTIMKKSGKTLREYFQVEFCGLNLDSLPFGMIISCSAISSLSEYVNISHDRVTFGKWNSEAEVLAADPEFFQKMAMYMTRAAIVVTMGDFCPNIPENKNVAV